MGGFTCFMSEYFEEHAAEISGWDNLSMVWPQTPGQTKSKRLPRDETQKLKVI